MSQSQEVKFFQVIKDDSVEFFIRDGAYTADSCSEVIRYARVDNEGRFNGFFSDVSRQGRILIAGEYLHGVRNGVFKTFFNDGTVASHGKFQNGVPVGEWKYYYESGLPCQTLGIENQDTLLMQYIDPKAKIKVTSGNGAVKDMFNGGYKFSGQIKNGRPFGRWTAKYAHEDQIIFTEEFSDGKFVKGTWANTDYPIRTYTNRSKIYLLYVPPVLEQLEQYTVVPCERRNEQTSPYFRLESGFFDSDFRFRLQQLLEDELTYRQIQSVSGEINMMTVAIYPGKDGQAEKISLNSSWGIQLYNATENALRANIRILGYEGPVYFHLNIRFEGRGVYRYSYSFSENVSSKN